METPGALDLHRIADASSDGGEDSRKNSTIAVWSNHDRGIIEPRSWLFYHENEATIHGAWFQWIVASFWSEIEAIMASFWSKVEAIVASFWSKIKGDSSRIWSHNASQWKPLPRRIKFAPTTASIAHDLRPKFLTRLNRMVIECTRLSVKIKS